MKKSFLILSLAGLSLTPLNTSLKKNNSIQKESILQKELLLKLETSETSWKNKEEYDSFVRSTINSNYEKDIKEIYNFYGITNDLPKYKFTKTNSPNHFECEGAYYVRDSIFFNSMCTDEMFQSYTKYFEKTNQNQIKRLTKRLHHFIKHEASHAFYYELAKKIGKPQIIKSNRGLTDLEYIKTNLIEEGVAEYMSHKGELTKLEKRFTDEDLMKIKENSLNLYSLGFLLVKPILDLNFQKGVEELINNPLKEKDLENILEYREKILENIKNNQ